MKGKRSPRDKRKSNPERMRLTQRDLAVLEAVYAYRYLTTQQLQRLFFPSMHSAYERLAKLYHQGFLERVFRGVYTDKMNTPILYVLARRGAETLAQHLDREIHWQRSQQDVGDKFLEHNTAINDIRIHFTLACQASPNQLLYWMSEFDLRADYDRVPIFTASGKRRNVALIPDSYAFLKTLKGEYGVFFEVDMGTMALEHFKNKVRAYLQYRGSEALKKRFAISKFAVLTLTPSTRRMKNLKLATETLSTQKRSFYFATLDSLTPQSIFDKAIWYKAGDKEPQGLFK